MARLSLNVVIKGGRFIWYCRDVPTEAAKMSLVTDLSRCLIRTALKTMPQKPEQGKWTKDSCVTLQSG